MDTKKEGKSTKKISNLVNTACCSIRRIHTDFQYFCVTRLIMHRVLYRNFVLYYDKINQSSLRCMLFDFNEILAYTRRNKKMSIILERHTFHCKYITILNTFAGQYLDMHYLAMGW